MPDSDRSGYRDQVIYISRQISALVAAIIAHANRPPVIVIQGDHGPVQLGGDAHMAILNAYYLPGADAAAVLYPSISPVNTFRVIFNQYLGGHYSLLPDRAYLSSRDTPFQFSLIANDRPGCGIP